MVTHLDICLHFAAQFLPEQMQIGCPLLEICILDFLQEFRILHPIAWFIRFEFRSFWVEIVLQMQNVIQSVIGLILYPFSKNTI